MHLLDACLFSFSRSHCQAAVLAVVQCDPGDLNLRARHASQLQVNGLLPSVMYTPSTSTCSPVFGQVLQVTGAPSLPAVGFTQGSSSPLEGKNLVVLVMIQSRDGRTGAAVVLNVQPGAKMEQWLLLMDPGMSAFC